MLAAATSSRTPPRDKMQDGLQRRFAPRPPAPHSKCHALMARICASVVNLDCKTACNRSKVAEWGDGASRPTIRRSIRAAPPHGEDMKRILIADDDAEMRETLQLALADRFDVALAANGFEAMRRLQNGAFDAVVLDLSMPVHDGRGVVREMRRRGITVPILIVSGETELPMIAVRLD